MCPRHIKEKCYSTYVGPTLEYASSVWDPHTTKNVKKLEAVHRCSARYICSDYKPESSPTSMLQHLQWPTLQLRCQQAKAAMMCRIVNKLVAFPKDMHLFHSQSTTRGDDLRFHQPHTRVLAYKHSFFPSAIRIWNSLPSDLTY